MYKYNVNIKIFNANISIYYLFIIYPLYTRYISYAWSSFEIYIQYYSWEKKGKKKDRKRVEKRKREKKWEEEALQWPNCAIAQIVWIVCENIPQAECHADQWKITLLPD